MNPASIHGDAGLIPVLAQRIKNLVLPRAVVWVADVAWIWCRCGYGVGWHLKLQFNPLAWKFPYAAGVDLKSPPHTHTYTSGTQKCKSQCLASNQRLLGIQTGKKIPP